MVKVATRPAENPVGLVARKLNLGGMVRDSPKLNLPGKLVFPSMHQSGHFSMLGLGDIVMPGLLLCFVLRYDSYKKSQISMTAEAGVPPPKSMLGSKLTYFHCSLVGWVIFECLHSRPLTNPFQLFSWASYCYGWFRGLQAGPTGALVSRSLHASPTAYHGLPQGRSSAHVDRTVRGTTGHFKAARSLKAQG